MPKFIDLQNTIHHPAVRMLTRVFQKPLERVLALPPYEGMAKKAEVDDV